MNIYKMGFLAVCITAATALSACGGPTDEEVIASDTPSEVFVGQRPPLEKAPGADGKDHLKLWSSTESDPDMEAVCNDVGLQYCSFPTDEALNLGYISLAALEARCFVAFSPIGADLDKGHLSIVVFSRFNEEVKTGTWDLTLPEISKVINDSREFCRA